jgi:hypothetical protein
LSEFTPLPSARLALKRKQKQPVREPEKISARISFLAKSRLPSFFNLIDFIKFVSIFMKG